MTAGQLAGATIAGHPRQGPRRELKWAVEKYWKGRASAAELAAVSARLRRQTWLDLADAGLTEVPTGDFSWYDHVLDTSVMLGVITPRHEKVFRSDPVAGYFAMARGTADAAPLEMTKWFATNYHYLVPELGPDTTFSADPSRQVGFVAEALALGLTPRPVLVGPITYLLLAKPAPGVADTFDPLTLLDRILPAYVEILAALRTAGAEWVQLDEPALVQDRSAAELAAFSHAYQVLGAATGRSKIVVASYFDTLGEALPVLAGSPVEGLAVDLVGPAAATLPGLLQTPDLQEKRLYAGVVDGHNVWANDLSATLAVLEQLRSAVGELVVTSSCSLLHVPIDVELETTLDPEVRPWLAFARQKVAEIAVLARGLRDGGPAIAAELAASDAVVAARAASPISFRPEVRDRAAAVVAEQVRRATPYAERAVLQRKRLALPLLPTTTIGSFPQTADLRAARADLRAGRIDEAEYEAAMRNEIAEVIRRQTELGLDVLVHGEPERNDMVQYFAEHLDGYLVTEHGWVQSYGSRCVRPPILAGDVSRPAPMTVPWTSFAASLTSQPVKGMLTGPVTMLAWSFVRDDLPRGETARQVALALRDEVADLEAAGTAVIQVDEPALRETLPLREADRAAYLAWATEAFRLTTSGVLPETQIHTHMCYAEFGAIIDAIDDLDADVISLEAARSHMEVAHELAGHGYPREVGPGVYDIHSPRVPSVEEQTALLRLALQAVPAERLWVNPDCGLKTRAWPETTAALENLVAAAQQVRSELT